MKLASLKKNSIKTSEPCLSIKIKDDGVSITLKEWEDGRDR